MPYDIAIVGGGPAGLSAAVNARARNKSVLVVSNDYRESPLYRAKQVDNYLGMPGQSGAALPAYQKGDMLEHKAFGRGMVLSVQKMGGDALLEIAFDNVGTKRLMLKSAAQHMKKL